MPRGQSESQIDSQDVSLEYEMMQNDAYNNNNKNVNNNNFYNNKEEEEESSSDSDVHIEVDSEMGSGKSSPYAVSGYVTSIAVPDESHLRPVRYFF